ncbi:virulence factor SrfB [Flavobacterium branchiophilum]|uniref:Virulence factor SrfB n=1 Tax=Flavobacterium branchiophilum TaxID=55197 RepID=A0A543G3F8_9FLAO|nr:virulence factor SrfB [Flavobacterium branchiophilum]OXA72237.1 virulence factor SrfB [Flavobacterium branchiophilum] [Flavobacterium branchiophilum NBRC 15030 = ATCC 35035]TQM40608.1 hypothetical protein BC670_1506 [Flavobacterium branchiophilum]GEM55969.1 hypothetical protein FB1_21900 [Flavobacterium branchiophilum NBRC 15030 = ATCC 35035]
MKRISLISNTSIQYYKYNIDIDMELNKKTKLYYHEPFDSKNLKFIYDPLLKYNIDGDEIYLIKQELIEKEYLINNKLIEDINIGELKQISEPFSTSNLKKAIKAFKNKWIPIPFFKENTINKNLLFPTDWVRVFISCNEEITKADIVLAIDTTSAKNEYDLTSPKLSKNPEENIFKLNSNDINIRNYVYDPANIWLNEYLSEIYYGNNEELKLEKPYNQYLANYLLLINWIAAQKELPEIQIFTDESKKIEVDLVVDLGNSSTCALLFENTDKSNFLFNKVKKLNIQNYSNPLLEYNNPFPMNVIFCESNFGKINTSNYHNKKFIVPSFVRIGYEAQEIISEASLNLNHGYEIHAYNSSPKRYLWDTKQADMEWDFYPFSANTIKKVYLPGISEQLNTKGDLLNPNEIFGSKSLFSKNALMKFVFLEILIHAYVQINSYAFREEHGNLTTPRTLKRITISCPTGMIQYEQIQLRKAAQDACVLLNNYVKFYFDSDDNKFWFEIPEIIPTIKDLEKNIAQQEDRKDWNYDESTSCQLVFLYGLVTNKLKNHSYVIDNFLLKGKENITIASIDIGAGTTDLMINKYNITNGEKIKLKPTPLFWDSFKLAGDDLLKVIIQQIIIEGDCLIESEKGAVGVLENYAKSLNIEHVSDKLNSFFGPDSNNMGLKAQLMRKNFIIQIAIPIATYYIQNANATSNSNILTFEEIIGKPFRNKELISYFETHFGFNFLDIKWNISSKKVNQIINSVFDGLAKQIAMISNQFECDYVVLSGKPCSSNSLNDLFLKYLACSPQNVINLNKVWIGTWFPFSDSLGFIKDPKTTVSVGAIIALMGGKLKKINDFELDIENLKKDIISNADTISKQNFQNKEIILSPKKNDNTITINRIPEYFGYSKFDSKNYPISSLNALSFNDEEILKSLKNKYPNKDFDFYSNQLAIEKNKFIQALPLKINITRDFDESKEIVKIESIEDAEGNDRPTKYLSFSFQTLNDVRGYWLDTCEFNLKC